MASNDEQDRGFLKVFSLEARRIPAVIVGRKIFKAFDLAGEKPRPSGL